MNITPDQISHYLDNAQDLINILDKASDWVDEARKHLDLPDSDELQAAGERNLERIAFEIEDLNTALANAEQELMDAHKHLDRLMLRLNELKNAKK